MPYKQMPTFSPTKTQMLEIPQPGVGGLNLFDLEYEQDVSQTPYMLNMMYRNGTFGKRYGQEIYKSFEDKIYAVCYFNNQVIVHSGSNIYIDNELVDGSLPQSKGVFIKYAQSLIYYCDTEIYEYKYENGEWLWTSLEPYVPEAFINCQPASGGSYDRMDDLNLLTLKYKCVYNGDGTSKDYYPYGNEDDILNFTVDPIVYVDDVRKTKGTDFTVNTSAKKITFTTAPASGTNNVEITYTIKENHLKEDRDRVYNSKYFTTYGANGTSHLFLAGGGDSKLFYSDSYDPYYIPENNWTILGSTEEDITGFGQQYNVLLVFKPKEIYSMYSYTTTASMVTSENEEDIGTEAFTSQTVNSQIGCDAPHTIQLINNQLTWFNSREGVCTLVSTNVSDERNVRVLSRNINNTNNLKVKGILEYNEDLDSIQSYDFDYKYFLVFPTSGMCYMWDYAISPFTYTSSKITDPKTLDWFLFDKFYVKQFIRIGKDLCFITDNSLFEKKIIKLGKKLSDLDYNNDGIKDPINAYYMTPLNQFNAVEYLKTINNIYVQCRGDVPTTINIKYITEDAPNGEVEPEPIAIYSNIFDGFTWESFGWETVNFANTFRRKCSIKKIQVAGILFFNNDLNCDMSISHLAMQYQVIKNIK